MINNSKLKKFGVVFIELLYIQLIDLNKKNIFEDSAKKLYFNWGVIWSTFSPLLLIIGLSILVSIGLRGRAFQLEYIVFIFLFWFAFTSIVSETINFKPTKFLISKKFINPWLLIIVLFSSNFLKVFLRFLVVYLAMIFLEFELQPYHLCVAMVLLLFFGFFYGTIISSLFHNNAFFSDLHGYFLQALFFTSSIIIPVTRLPENLREILLYNPIVHLMEWIKVPTSGINYTYIDINYFIAWFLILLLIFPLSLYKKNDQCLSMPK